MHLGALVWLKSEATFHDSRRSLLKLCENEDVFPSRSVSCQTIDIFGGADSVRGSLLVRDLLSILAPLFDSFEEATKLACCVLTMTLT